MQRTSIMQSTSSALLRALHPPLPLDQKQARQLLNALSSSFQRHLDKHHPTGATLKEQKRVDQGSRRPRSDSSASSYLQTQKHFSTIINHPHFVRPRMSPTNSQEQAKADALFQKLQEYLRSGHLRTRHVRECILHLGRCNRSSEPAYCSLIPSLVQSTGELSMSDVLQDHKVCAQWVSQMFYEGHEQAVWKIIVTEGGPDRLMAVFASVGLKRKGLPFVIRLLTLASQFEHLATSASNTTSIPFALARNMLMHNQQYCKSLSPERYSSIVDEFTKSYHDSKFHGHRFLAATLDLLHPEAPSAVLTCKLLQYILADEEAWITWTKKPDRLQTLHLMSYRAALTVLPKDDPDMVDLVLDFIRYSSGPPHGAPKSLPQPTDRDSLASKLDILERDVFERPKPLLPT